MPAEFESRPLRVLMISHGCQSRTEGQPRAVLLGKMPGIDLRVLTPIRWNDYGRWRGVQEPVEASFDLRPMKVRLPWTGPGQWYLHYYPDLASEVKAFQPDIINVWEEPWSLVAAQACRVRDKVMPSAKIVIETEQNIYKKLPPPFRQLRRYVLDKTDVMIARSREAIEVLRQLNYKRQAELVPNAVDTDLFHPKDRASCRRTIAAETGVDWSDRFIVGFVGRLVVQKGIFELVDAIAKCSPNVVLLIIGSGAAESEVRGRIRSLNMVDRVIFLPARPLEQLPEIFGAMDVLAVPSRTTPRWKEQFGRVIIEAHASQIPVIGSKSGAIPDVIGAGGLIIDEQDPAGLAAAINQLFQDAGARESLGKAGLSQVTQKYSWYAISRQLSQIYYSLLKAELGGIESTSAI